MSASDDGLSIWLELTTWLVSAAKELPQIWPDELPPENTPGFWWDACRLEIATRSHVSTRIQKGLICQSFSMLTPLELWFLHRRFEWASQLALAYAEARE